MRPSRKVASQVIYVGAPGAATPHTATLPYRKIRRPRWPLDDVSTPVLMTLAQTASTRSA